MLFQQMLNGLVAGSIYALVATGLTLIFGIMRVPNFAHGTIYMIGAYFTFWIITILKVNLFFSILLTLILVTILGLIIERVVFKPVRNRSATDVFIIALGLWAIMENAAFYIWGPETRLIPSELVNIVLTLSSLTITLNRILILFVSPLILVGIFIFMKKTSFGKAMRAVAEDRTAAGLVGIGSDRVFGITFAVGSALAALAGALVGSTFSIFPAMGAMPILKAFCAIVLGGMGSITGAIFGSYILGLSESLGAAYITSTYKEAFAFLILIVVLLIRPYGLFGKEEEE
jgi:branched-chain amino acid transport system permease protein